jgi:hypothetical protein
MAQCPADLLPHAIADLQSIGVLHTTGAARNSSLAQRLKRNREIIKGRFFDRPFTYPAGWNGIPGCPALAGSGVSTSRLMTTGSCPLLTTTASQISFGLPLIS